MLRVWGICCGFCYLVCVLSRLRVTTPSLQGVWTYVPWCRRRTGHRTGMCARAVVSRWHAHVCTYVHYGNRRALARATAACIPKPDTACARPDRFRVGARAVPTDGARATRSVWNCMECSSRQPGAAVGYAQPCAVLVSCRSTGTTPAAPTHRR